MAIKTASGSGLTNSLSSGLVLLNTTSFSGVASQSLPANTFSSSYTNYLIKGNVISATPDALNFRLRASGVDASAANYNLEELFAGGAGGTTVSGGRTTGSTSGFTSVTTATIYNNFELNLYSPNVAVPTSFNDITFRTDNTASISIVCGYHTLSIAYDSITFLTSSSYNISGTLWCYGYNK